MIGCRSLSDKYVQPSAIAAADAYVGENMYAVGGVMHARVLVVWSTYA